MRRSAAQLAAAARAPRGCPRPRQVASGTDLQALIRHPGAATVPIGACSRSLPNGRSQLPLPRFWSGPATQPRMAWQRLACASARAAPRRQIRCERDATRAVEFLSQRRCAAAPRIDHPGALCLPLHKPLLQRSVGAPSASSTTQVLMPIHRHLAVTVHPHIHRTDHPCPRTPTPFTATCFEWILG